MNIEYYLDHFMSDSEDTEDVDLVFSSDSEPSSEENDVTELHLHGKVTDFIKTIENYSEVDFKSHFHLKRSTVLILIDKYHLSDNLSVGPGRPKLNAKLDIYMFVWYVSSTITFRQLANLFGVAKSTAWNVVVRVSDFFIDTGHEYLKWPSHEEAKIISNKFEQLQKIPNIIGVMGWTHIKIKAPRQNPRCYYNRKKYFSVSMQVIVDANKQFIDIYCGEPGSYHDGIVLQRSTIYKEVEENMAQYFRADQFILANIAYPAKEWIVPPYNDHGALTDGERIFNMLHSSTRDLVLNAKMLLKTRFRRLLHFTENIDLTVVTRIVYSACILHNICLAQNDLIDGNSLFEEEEITSKVNLPVSVQQHNRRERLYMELQDKDII